MSCMEYKCYTCGHIWFTGAGCECPECGEDRWHKINKTYDEEI